MNLMDRAGRKMEWYRIRKLTEGRKEKMWKRDKCYNPTEGLHMGENENVTMRRKFSTGLNQDHPWESFSVDTDYGCMGFLGLRVVMHVYKKRLFSPLTKEASPNHRVQSSCHLSLSAFFSSPFPDLLKIIYHIWVL
jgi:hypothetical protein